MLRPLHATLRRSALPAVLSCVLAGAVPAAAQTVAFGFEEVSRRAEKLAAAPHQAPETTLHRDLRNLSYDAYRDIRYKPSRAHWGHAGVRFEVTFVHQGHHFDRPVRINEISLDGVREIHFNPASFDYGANRFSVQQLEGMGFAGFRVHYPLNRAEHKDEVLTFLGASFFRAVAAGQHFGMSARGLALDTALASGEEFPRFVEFWIARPAPGDEELIVYALLDSRSAAGAYRFVLRPGAETAIDVRARLFMRRAVAKLGLAPLTSMFLFGENQGSAPGDYRPEVHSSDGLSIQADTGEWIWRPLVNPRRLLVTSFAVSNPVGFGLMQRDHAFSSYQDLDARYDLRPSAWVRPGSRWGEGRIELVQIPTPDETNDNIVAFWVPESTPKPGEPYDYDYRLLWQRDGGTRPPLSWVTQSRRGQSHRGKPEDRMTFRIDFEGPSLKKLAPDAAVTGIVTSDPNGEILESVAQPNAVTGGWRLTVRLRRIDDAKPVELRGFLRRGNQTVSETWSYVLPPI
jgi:periplasmic glucans biosynthesis protein